MEVPYNTNYERDWPVLPFAASASARCVRTRPEHAPDNSAAAGILFSVDALLDADECRAVVEGAAPHQRSVDWEYVAEYRSCARAVLMSGQLASVMASRLASLWTREDVADVQPFGFGTAGVWVLPHDQSVVNPCMRVSSYGPGQYFAKHRDSGFVVDDNYRSIFTLLVYLNDDFEGGETVFHDAQGGSSDQVVMQPRRGSALLFTHEALHEGRPVRSGTKHVLRTDILFKRVLPLKCLGGALAHNPDFLEASRLYADSIRLQAEGKPGPSTSAFVKAVELHAKVHTAYSKLSRLQHPSTAYTGPLTRDIWLLVATHLPLECVVGMQRVNSYFRSVFRHPRLWSALFQQRWAPERANAVRSNFAHDVAESDMLSDFWYVAYQFRHLADVRWNVLWVDLTCNMASANMRQPQRRDELFAARVGDCSGHRWGSSSGLCNMIVGQELETNDQSHWPETVYAVEKVYSGSKEVEQVDTGPDSQFRYRAEWSRSTPFPSKAVDERGFSPFCAAMVVNHCYGRGYDKLAGAGEIRFLPFQHPVLAVVAPTVDARSVEDTYAWLGGLLSVLPYSLIMRADELVCHVFECLTCVCIVPTDVGISVSAVVEGRALADVRVLRFEESVISFPCPDVATVITRAKQEALERLLQTVTTSRDVAQFLRQSVADLCATAKTAAVVAAGGLLNDALYVQLSQLLEPQHRLQPLPRGLDASSVTGAAIRAFLASPSSAARFVSTRDRRVKEGEYRQRTWGPAIRPLMMDAQLRTPAMHVANVGDSAVLGYPRGRLWHWRDLLTAEQTALLAAQHGLEGELPPLVGAALSYFLDGVSPVLVETASSVLFPYYACGAAVVAYLAQHSTLPVLVVAQDTDRWHGFSSLLGELLGEDVCTKTSTSRVQYVDSEALVTAACTERTSWAGAVFVCTQPSYEYSPSAKRYMSILGRLQRMPRLFAMALSMREPLNMTKHFRNAVVIREGDADAWNVGK